MSVTSSGMDNVARIAGHPRDFGFRPVKIPGLDDHGYWIRFEEHRPPVFRWIDAPPIPDGYARTHIYASIVHQKGERFIGVESRRQDGKIQIKPVESERQPDGPWFLVLRFWICLYRDERIDQWRQPSGFREGERRTEAQR